MSEWITDRKPTAEDAYGKHQQVWVSGTEQVQKCHYELVEEGEPWREIVETIVTPKPAPYTKLKKCLILLHNDGSGLYRISVKGLGVPAYNIPTREAAERIALIYEEVLP